MSRSLAVARGYQAFAWPREEMSMLSDARFEASLPCSDLQRAKSFYAEKLGLSPSDEGPAGAFYAGRGGTRFILFPSSGSASGSHSQMGFMVADRGSVRARCAA